jgi:single-stranded-DNA-specific exonuclease
MNNYILAEQIDLSKGSELKIDASLPITKISLGLVEELKKIGSFWHG